MNDEDAGGAAADARAHEQWIERVRSKHRIKPPFMPPAARCRCGFQLGPAPADMGVIRQRDYMLDAYNEHLRMMRAEKKRWLSEVREARAKTTKATTLP